MPAMRQRPVRTATFGLAVWGLLIGCGTEPKDRPVLVTYAVLYDPAQVVSATEACDRLVTHILLQLNDSSGFELSANVQDDCTRVGQGFMDVGVFREGTYTQHGTALSFTSEGAAQPEFTGTLEARGIVLVFQPGLDSLASPVELRVPEASREF